MYATYYLMSIRICAKYEKLTKSGICAEYGQLQIFAVIYHVTENMKMWSMVIEFVVSILIQLISSVLICIPIIFLKFFFFFRTINQMNLYFKHVSSYDLRCSC